VFAAVPLLDGERHVATLALLVDARPRPAARAEEPAGVQPHQFEALAPQPGAPAGRRSLDLLRDVEMGVTAELGRARMTVRNLLELAPGAVVELDRAAGSPIDVLVNGTLVARGEVVVIGEEFGVRITEIVGPDADERGPGR
jgi:flagellar motor switch protein FliN/FliY